MVLANTPWTYDEHMCNHLGKWEDDSATVAELVKHCTYRTWKVWVQSSWQQVVFTPPLSFRFLLHIRFNYRWKIDLSYTSSGFNVYYFERSSTTQKNEPFRSPYSSHSLPQVVNIKAEWTLLAPQPKNFEASAFIHLKNFYNIKYPMTITSYHC